jgi:hypothetical protein
MRRVYTRSYLISGRMITSDGDGDGDEERMEIYRALKKDCLGGFPP